MTAVNEKKSFIKQLFFIKIYIYIIDYIYNII